MAKKSNAKRSLEKGKLGKDKLEYIKVRSESLGNLRVGHSVDKDNVKELSSEQVILAMQEEDALTPTGERFVAFIDVLGFKNMVTRHNSDYTYGRLKDVVKHPPKSKLISWYQFSDSIIVYSRNASKECASDITEYCQFLFKNAITCGTLLKGALAHGAFTADTEAKIFFGQPLIDAYELEETMYVSSMILHHTCEKVIIDFNDKELSKEFVYHDTAMKGFKVKHLHIAWAEKLATDKNIETDIAKYFPKLYAQASGSARKYVENTEEHFRTARNPKKEKSRKSRK